METHTEEIICPNCEAIQEAEVEHTMPWWTYIHECGLCGYTIMESEWNRTEDQADTMADD